MPSTPTTKSQVQAYRFVLRRMQSALVRKDAVMLHDPMRTHTRAITVGVIVSCLGLVGFVVFGLFKPSPSAPSQGIVISKESGAVYVATSNPRQLVPVLNLASARLMLMQESSSSGSNAPAPSEGGPAGGPPTVVDDSALQGIPRGRLAGIPGAPLLLPEKQEQRTSPNWAVCDQLDVQGSQPDAGSRANVQTTVLGGVADMHGLHPLGPRDAVLAAAPDGQTYLVYPTPPGSKIGASAVRARVDLSDTAVAANFNLRDAKPRRMTAAELNAIPEVRRLAVPNVDGEGAQPKGYDVGIAAKIGTVVQAQVAGEDPHYYLVLKDGLQQVSPAVAQLFQAENAPNQQVIPSITARQEATAPRTQNPLPVGDFPAERPNVISASDAPVSCLSWSLKDGDEHTEVLLGSQVPVPQGMQPVQLNQPGAGGELVKWFYLPPGHAAMVRSVSSKADFASGPLTLVADTGVRFGIPDVATATALGVNTNNGNFDPAPDAILRLLPAGPSLNHNDALRTFDTVPVDNRAGTWPTPTSTRSAGGS
ncbi:type VII secretion protein EccB [Gandjariella thermophila]|uniref:Type VII secretion protein EccB n=1 Tax=Gandjariella thermophila TaxID=1931992 RepID=A0A4D4J5Q5_9PSEU|nr:type VII secretion protein EccB [Gandjariella thermophila]GDY29317.1 type VII secretion protein EccB [Gandjariella thermophila]